MAKVTLQAIEKLIQKAVAPFEIKISEIHGKIDAILAKLDPVTVVNQTSNGKDGVNAAEQERTRQAPKTDDPAPKPARGGKPAGTSPAATAIVSARSVRANARTLYAQATASAARKSLSHSTPEPAASLTIAPMSKSTTEPAPISQPNAPDPSDCTPNEDSPPAPCVAITPASQVDVQQTPLPDAKDKTWNTAMSRKRKNKNRRNIVVGEGLNSDDIKGVERLTYIQAWSFRPETTTDNVLNFLKKTDNSNDYFVEKRNINTDRHASFLIGIPETIFEKFNSPAAWPPRVRFTDWFLGRPRQERGVVRSPRNRPAAATA
jgi:hypothetical protein